MEDTAWRVDLTYGYRDGKRCPAHMIVFAPTLQQAVGKAINHCRVYDSGKKIQVSNACVSDITHNSIS